MLKLNIGLSRKIGESNYGSRGASINLEVQLEADLVREPHELHRKIQYLFGLAKEAVEAELAGNGNVQACTVGSNVNGEQRRNVRRATQSQVRAIHAIADRQHKDLSQLMLDRFHVTRPEDLAIAEASELIDELKSVVNGTGGRR